MTPRPAGAARTLRSEAGEAAAETNSRHLRRRRLSTTTAACAPQPLPNYACAASGVAEQLNDLFNAETDSYTSSGLFGHGFDCSVGNLKDDPTNLTGQCDFATPMHGAKLPAWELDDGSWALVGPDADAACPAWSETQQPETAGAFPRVCPTPKGQNVGAVSFAYLRRDIMTPFPVVQSWNNSGKLPLETSGDKYTELWGPVGIFLTGAKLDLPAPCPKLEPVGDFWEDDRLLAMFVRDGDTFDRDACGAGVTNRRIIMGLGNNLTAPGAVNATALNLGEFPQSWTSLNDTVADWAPASCESLSFGSPFCPDSVTDADAWYQHVDAATNAYWDLISGTAEPINHSLFWDKKSWAEAWAWDGQCSLDKDRFQVFAEARRYDNMPQAWKDRLNPERPEFEQWVDIGWGVWNEVLIKSYAGVKLKDMAPHMALYYMPGPGVFFENAAAEAYSVAEGIYAKTGISVPVVEVDVEALYLDPEEVKQPFTCGTPPDTQAKDHLMSVQLKPSTSP